jgi:transposase
MAYSVDLRKKVIEYLSSGHSQREARDVFHISLSAINKWHQQYKQTGKLEDKKPSRSYKKLEPVKLEEYVRDHPDAYLQEIGEAFGCVESSVRKALRRLGITRKKRRSGTVSKSLSK